MTGGATPHGPKAHADALLAEVEAACARLATREDPAKPFSVLDLADLLQAPRARAYDVIRRLVATGRAEVAEAGHGATPGRWRLTQGPKPQRARKPATAAEQMWAAMRAMKSFSPTSLATHADVGEVEVTVEAARRYCRALLAAGYLRVVQRADRGHEAVYRLQQRSGLKAPVLRRVQAVIDANTGTTTVVGGAA